MTRREPPGLTIVQRSARALDAGERHAAAVYGRLLTWSVNDAAFEAEIEPLIRRWSRADVPPTGAQVVASAYLVPYDGEAARVPSVVGHVMPPGVLLLSGASSFTFLSPDQRSAVAVVREGTDLRWAAESLVEPLWMGLFTVPPMYAIHGAAVARGGKAAILVGDHASGKSTLAAGLVVRHGFEYLGDDTLLVDGRNLRVYGRWWRVELRDPTPTIIWSEVPPHRFEHHDKRVWDERAFDGRIALSAAPAALCFLERSDQATVRRLSVSEARRALGAPIRMYGRSRTLRGYRPVFDSLARDVPAFGLGIMCEEGIAPAIETVAELLDGLGS